MRKLASGILLITAISVGLGALGHAHQWSVHVLPGLSGMAGLELKLLELLKLVWYWVSGAMLVLGILLVWSWDRLRRGDRRVVLVPYVIAVFYLVEGVYGAIYLGPFFLLFAIQAALLFGTTLVLQRPALTPGA